MIRGSSRSLRVVVVNLAFQTAHGTLHEDVFNALLVRLADSTRGDMILYIKFIFPYTADLLAP